MVILNAILGLLIIYAWIHFAIVQHLRKYTERTVYEKVVTWVALVGLILYIIGTMSR